MGLQEDFIFCENIIKESSKSFYKAFSKLPSHKANGVYAVYAFCRIVDDLIDVKKDANALLEFSREFSLFKEEMELDQPLWRALRWTFSQFHMSYEPFDDMIKGQLMDLDFKQPSTQEELENYCYYVAGTVGLMILPILSERHLELKDTAMNLGRAMQITNILRDVGEDYRINRIYLLKETMAKFYYTEDMLAGGAINSSFISLWEHEAQRAEELYAGVYSNLSLFDSDSIFPVILAINFYRNILDQVRANNYDCMTRRNFVPKWRKILLYFSSVKTLNGLKMPKGASV